MKPNDPRDIHPLVKTEGGLLRDMLASAETDHAREEQLEGLHSRLAPLFTTALPIAAAGGVKAATKLAIVKAAAKSVLSIKVAIGVAAIGAASGGAYYVVAHRAPAIAPVVVPSAPRVQTTAPPLPTATTPAPTIDDSAPAPSAKKPPTTKVPVDAAAEFDLVQRGGDALLQRHAGDALSLANEHARRFPGGAHAEDRERIAIEALVDLGRTDEAKTRARRFFARYPSSAYRPRIESLVPGAR